MEQKHYKFFCVYLNRREEKRKIGMSFRTDATHGCKLGLEIGMPSPPPQRSRCIWTDIEKTIKETSSRLFCNRSNKKNLILQCKFCLLSKLWQITCFSFPLDLWSRSYEIFESLITNEWNESIPLLLSFFWSDI